MWLIASGSLNYCLQLTRIPLIRSVDRARSKICSEELRRESKLCGCLLVVPYLAEPCSHDCPKVHLPTSTSAANEAVENRLTGESILHGVPRSWKSRFRTRRWNEPGYRWKHRKFVVLSNNRREQVHLSGGLLLDNVLFNSSNWIVQLRLPVKAVYT